MLRLTPFAKTLLRTEMATALQRNNNNAAILGCVQARTIKVKFDDREYRGKLFEEMRERENDWKNSFKVLGFMGAGVVIACIVAKLEIDGKTLQLEETKGYRRVPLQSEVLEAEKAKRERGIVPQVDAEEKKEAMITEENTVRVTRMPPDLIPDLPK